MIQKKLIIVEGAMKTGKSHFIKEVKQECIKRSYYFTDFCSDIYRDIFINNFLESPTLSQRKAFDLGRILGLRSAFDTHSGNFIVVMDRFYLTNAIYAEAFSRGRKEYVETIEVALEKYLKDVDVFLVVLSDTVEGIVSRLHVDERNMQYTEEDVLSLLTYFSEFFTRSQIKNKYYQSCWEKRNETISSIFGK